MPNHDLVYTTYSDGDDRPAVAAAPQIVGTGDVSHDAKAY